MGIKVDGKLNGGKSIQEIKETDEKWIWNDRRILEATEILWNQLVNRT